MTDGPRPQLDPSIEDIPTALLLVRDGTVVAANGLAVTVLQAAENTLVGTVIATVVVPEDAPELTSALADAGQSLQVVRARIPAPTTSASLARLHLTRQEPVEFTLRATADGDVLVAVRSRQLEHRLGAIIDALGTRTMILDDQALVSWHSELVDSREHNPTVRVGTNPLAWIHPEDLPPILDAFGSAVNSPGSVVHSVARSRGAADDVWQSVEIIGSSLLNDPLVGGIVVQVRALGEQEIVESVGRTAGQFLSLADAAPVGIVVLDAFSRTVYRNAAARVLLPADLPDEDAWRSLARAPHRADLDEMISSTQTAEQQSTAVMAFDLPTGSTRWIRVHTSPRYDDAGKQSIGTIATLEDVTAEVDARSQATRLMQMLDATSDYVAVFRPDGEILYMNAATKLILDARKADGCAGQLADLIDDEPRRAWIAAALEVLQGSDTWQGELELNTGGDRKVAVSALGVVKRHEDGTLDWIAMLARDISDQKAAEDNLRRIATHDHLTGLPNRPLFNDRLERAVARHKRDRRGIAVMFCDLDGFKAINDEHGHASGDHVLITVAERLRTATRETDTPARVGGDEFVVVCEGVSDSDDLALLAERVIEAVAEPIELPDGASITLGISVGIGVARSRQEHVDPDALLTLADTAMYRAKARGGSSFRITALSG